MNLIFFLRALFILWWREAAGLSLHWAWRFWAEYRSKVCSCAQEEEYRLYAENSLSEVAGKLSDSGSTSVTTAKIFILEMIKAVLKAAILWACSASAVSTCRRRGTAEWASRDREQIPAPLLVQTGGVLDQQRAKWKKTNQVWVFPHLKKSSERLLHWFAVASLWLHYLCSSLLRLCSWKARCSPLTGSVHLQLSLKLWQTRIPGGFEITVQQ